MSLACQCVKSCIYSVMLNMCSFLVQKHIHLFLYISSGVGVQRAESSGDHHRRVCGCPDHAALHGSWTAHLEEVDMNTDINTHTNNEFTIHYTSCQSQIIIPWSCYTNIHRHAHVCKHSQTQSLISVNCHTLHHSNPDYSNPMIRGVALWKEYAVMLREWRKLHDHQLRSASF